MIAFQTSVAIDRPLEQVFAYVSDPVNFPSWNSAVQVVRPTSAGSSGVGSTYSMERQLPTGRATNKLEIVVREHPHEFAIRTIEGPTPFLYRYRFAAEGNQTVVKLDGQVELPAVAVLMPQLVRRAVKHGIDDNLTTLKLTLEDAGGMRSERLGSRVAAESSRPRTASQSSQQNRSARLAVVSPVKNRARKSPRAVLTDRAASNTAAQVPAAGVARLRRRSRRCA